MILINQEESLSISFFALVAKDGSALASSSEDDLLKKIRSAYVPGRDTTSLKQRISNKLKKNRKSSQCSLIKGLEIKLEKNVGRYRHDKSSST